MPHSIAILLAVLLLTSAATARNESPSTSRASPTIDFVLPESTMPNTGLLLSLGIDETSSAGFIAERCCKVCTTGKACGDTCISRDKDCHVGPGCACDG